MADQQPTFAERSARMRRAAAELKAILEIVDVEAASMTAAEKRFADRRTKKPAR